jgi:hypothetical protein
MRTLALLAITSLPLLGGCVSTVCDPPTARFAWSLQDTNGSGWSCAQAGVAQVDVYIGHGVSPVTFRCADYDGTIDVSGLAPGRYPTTVEGVDSTGTIIDRAQFDVAVGNCGGTTYAPVLGEARLQIDYHFGTPGTGADTCYGGGAGYMWFDLWDDVAGQPLSSITTATSTAYPSWRDHYACGAPGPAIMFSVPFGSYTLKGIQEVVSPLSAPAAVAETCSPTTVTVDRLGVGTITYLTPLYLVPPTSALACYPGAAP